MDTLKRLYSRCVADRYLVLGHLCLLVLMVLAVVYANQRVLLTDSAYQVFYDINHPGVLINDSRYTMVLTQILPWIAIHLHAPLKVVIVSYSISFILVGYACWLITAYAMKQRKAATLMLFVLPAIGGTFLHCISESFQLMFYAPMLYGWLCCRPDEVKVGRAGYYTILALLVAITFFIYPMAAVYIVFAAGFKLFDDGRLRFTAPPLVTLGLLAVYAVLYVLMGMSGHDSEFVPTAERLRYALTHFFTLGSITVFYKLFFSYYLFPLLLLIITLVGYARRGQWLKMAYVAACVVGFFVAAVIIYWEGDSYISRERYYIPLFFMIGLAFLEDGLPRFSQRQQTVFFVVFSTMMVYSFGRIVNYVHRYQPRMDAIAEVCRMGNEQGQHKLLVTRSTAEEVFPLDIWGLALESMLLSAQEGPEQTVTIYKEEDDFDRANADLYDNPEVYVSVNWWKRWEVKELNPRYFRLPAQGYKELKKTEEGYVFVAL